MHLAHLAWGQPKHRPHSEQTCALCRQPVLLVCCYHAASQACCAAVQVKGKGLMETYLWQDPRQQQQAGRHCPHAVPQLQQQQSSGPLSRYAAAQRQQTQTLSHSCDSSQALSKLPAAGSLSNGNISLQVLPSGGSLVQQRLSELERFGYIKLQSADKQPSGSRRRHSNLM